MDRKCQWYYNFYNECFSLVTKYTKALFVLIAIVNSRFLYTAFNYIFLTFYKVVGLRNVSSGVDPTFVNFGN